MRPKWSDNQPPPGRATRFVKANPELDTKITLMHSSPYERGWLFQVRGELDERCVDAKGYCDHLDLTIDKMMGQSS